MKSLLNLFDRIRPYFAEGGKMHAGKPLFDAGENFLFAPATRTIGSPHVRDPLDVKRFMSMVIIGLAPCVAASLYFFGLRMLAIIVVSYAAGGIVEVVFAVVRKEEINEGFLVTGLLFPLILPPTMPLWMVAVGVAFGVLVGKELFGGTGRNLFNPALVGRCFLALAYPKTMSENWVKPVTALPGRLGQYITASNADAVTMATPLTEAKHNQLAPLGDLFFGNVPGCGGETSALLVIAGGVFLLIVGVASWRTVAATLGSFALLAGLMHWLQPGQFGPAVWHLLAGGLLFGAFFMATDPVTSPITNTGKYAFGIIIGVSTWLIRNLAGYVEGVMFAILLGNIAAPILDEMVFRVRLRRMRDER